MTYLVSPTDPATPTDDQGATQGAEELRALKGYLSGLLGFPTGFNTFRKNAIINGDFNIWQRSTSFGSVPHGTYTADRWVYGKTSAAVHDILRSTDLPTVAQVGRLLIYSYHLDCTTADAAVAAGDYTLFQQLIEGYNFLPLAQEPFVLSFWVKATKIGIHCVSFCNGGFDRTYIAEYTINVANTWEKKTIAVPASPSAGVWDYTNGVGLQVRFALMAGTTYQAAAGAWQVGNFLATVNQVNACDNVVNDFRIAAVQLEAGTIATPFEYRKLAEEVALCQRYFEKSYDLETIPGTLTTNGYVGVRASGPNGVAPIFFKVRKRAVATMTFYNHATGLTGTWQDASAVANVAVVTNSNGETCANAVVSTVADTNFAAGHWTASAEL